MVWRDRLLVVFGLSLRGVWTVDSYRYLILNFVGGWGLSAAAVVSHQWGFVLLEGVWGLFAGWSNGYLAIVDGSYRLSEAGRSNRCCSSPPRCCP